MRELAVRPGPRSFPAANRPGLEVRALVAGLLAVVGLVVVPAMPAEAATPGCPRGTPGVGGGAFFGDAGNNHITGTAGDDYICAGAGDDVVDGGGGNDHIYGGPGKDELLGGAGDDWIEGGGGNDEIRGGAGTDQLFGDAGRPLEHTPVAPSEAGNDLVFGDSGADVIEGGPGSDIIFPGGNGERSNGSDSVHGGPGNDAVVPSLNTEPTFSDSIFGDEGDDFLWPNPFRLSPLGNTVWGGPGHDIIIAANGLSDGVELDEPDGLKLPVVEGCDVTVPLLEDRPIGGSKAVLGCKLPLFGDRDVEATIGSDGKTTVTGSLLGTTSSLQVTQLQSVLKGGFSADTCLCDPKVGRAWPFFDRVD